MDERKGNSRNGIKGIGEIAMRIEIAEREVMEKIYAVTALQGYVNLPERERALLQEDQSEGLTELVRDAFAEVVIGLMPRVEGYEESESGTVGTMWIELKEAYAGAEIVRPAIERMMVGVMANMVLGAIYESVGEGAGYEQRWERGMEMMRETIDSIGGGGLPRLQGWR